MSNISYITHQSQELFSISNTFQIEILDYLIRSTNRYRKVFPSQYCIAQVVGCSQRTVNSHLRYFAEKGWLDKKKRYNTTSLYRLSRVFIDYAHTLRYKFKSLKHVYNLTLLLSFLPTKKNFTESYFQPTFVSRKNIDINYPIVSTLTRERSVVKKNKFRRRIDMKVPQISSILATITKRLNLTKWGQIRLIPFPDEALNYAYNEYQHSSNIKQSFNWFFAKANHYCITHDIEPHWKIYYEMAEEFNMPTDPKYIADNNNPVSKPISAIPFPG